MLRDLGGRGGDTQMTWYGECAYRSTSGDGGDAVAILERGRVAASAGIAELTARASANRLVVEVESDGAAAAVAGLLAGQAWLRSLETAERTLRMTVSDLPAAQREIPAAIASANVALRRFVVEEASLEDVFVELVGTTAR